MKITLINPPITVEEIYGKYSDLASFQPPVGLCALASYLIKYGYEVKILDANILDISIADIAKAMLDSRPHLIGIYTNTSNYYVVCKLTSVLKASNKERKIVLGGPHPTFLPEGTLTETEADCCVMGEGEETLLELVRAIESNTDDLSGISGLAFRGEDKHIIVNSPRKRIDDLDSLPFPAIHLLPELSKYKPYLLQYKRLPYMTLITSRGCPFACVFCNTPFGKEVRFHSPRYVVDYIEYLSTQFDVKELAFCDDTFTIDEERVFEMCAQIRKRKLDMTWYAATRANIKNKDLFREMKKSGCWICAIGVESSSPEILRLIGKKISLEKVKQVCSWVLESGLVLKTFFILGNPGETVETMDGTIKFAKSLKAHFPVFSLMTPYPGAELWDTADKYGTFDRSDFRKLLISTSEPVFIPHGLTKEILLKKQGQAFRNVYFNLGMLERQLATVQSLNDVDKLIRAGLAFVKVQVANIKNLGAKK